MDPNLCSDHVVTAIFYIYSKDRNNNSLADDHAALSILNHIARITYIYNMKGSPSTIWCIMFQT